MDQTWMAPTMGMSLSSGVRVIRSRPFTISRIMLTWTYTGSGASHHTLLPVSIPVNWWKKYLDREGWKGVPKNLLQYKPNTTSTIRLEWHATRVRIVIILILIIIHIATLPE